jgi:hypothetical protein
MVHCSENNVRKLENRYKFTWFIVAKIMFVNCKIGINLHGSL